MLKKVGNTNGLTIIICDLLPDPLTGQHMGNTLEGSRYGKVLCGMCRRDSLPTTTEVLP